jgi:tetratricopeptide (TPR) repeat protein
MRNLLRLCSASLLGALLLALLLALAPGVSAQGAAFDAGVAAYRGGDYAAAGELWSEALSAPLPPADKARVTYDLGNAAWRAGRRGEALGWYAAALREAPRHGDARANLEFAREELGLPPADEGSLAAAFRRAAGSLSRAEAAWGVLAASLLFFTLLVVEALRGGRLWRGLALGSGLLALAAAVPWVHAEATAGGDPHVAIGTPSVSLRAEPRTDLPVVATVEAGGVVERIDALGGWLRVETPDGERGWAPAEELFRLER